MADVLIVGDGPAGLSAALFLAKNGMEVTVFGQDRTPMHKAMLYNYLGIPRMTGTEFQQIARRQVRDRGAQIVEASVTAAALADGGFSVRTEDGGSHEAKYLLLASGPAHDLARQLGLEGAPDGSIRAERDGTTSVPNLFVAGWISRPDRIQAIISAGDGAAAALSILSAETGRNFHDFDVVE